MNKKVELNSINTTQAHLNVTCHDFKHMDVSYPFDGLFLNENFLTLVVNGKIKAVMAVDAEDRKTLLHSNESLR